MEPVNHGDDGAEVTGRPPARTPAPSTTPPEDERGLHPAVQIGWVVGRVVNAIFLGVMVTFAGASLARWLPLPPALLGLLVLVAVLLLGLWHARLLFTSWRWALREDDVYARFGVVWRVTRSIPRVRVQHVDITSGPIDRALGLVHVALHVAGSAGPVLTIPGLAPRAAEALREALLESAKVS